ncbi:glycoside hydrolase family 31 protein [Oryzibacter oryziterrae]|uniref:glycoside hydrolase family 31 protein n=1 Tax=Oryzibacter oryziterrae TaxID=2766474 RepID=UPI001F37F32B|nr:TIM-barrel domain-containing protein [Oryzibacter oryziterrae]
MTQGLPATTGTRPDLARATAQGLLCISAVSDRAFRVRITPEGTEDELPESEILQRGRPAAPAPRIQAADGVIRLDLPHIRCEFSEGTGRLRFFDRNGTLLLAEAEDGRRLVAAKLGDEDVHVAEQAFESPVDERLYGTGCFQDGALDLRGLPRRLTQVNTQISLPFLLSSRGYGLLWHHRGRAELNPPPEQVVLAKRSVVRAEVATVSTTSGGIEVKRQMALFEAEIDVAVAGRHALLLDIGKKMGTFYRVEIDGQTLAHHDNFWLPPTTSFLADLTAGKHVVKVEANDTDEPVLHFGLAHDRTVWRSPVAAAIDYMVIAGPSAGEVMGGYRALLGTTPMLPLWAFGYIHCRERFHSSAEILETLDEFRKRDLPLDVIVQDWQYWGDHGWNAMRFDEAMYPDPKGLLDEVHRRDARLMLSVWARIDPSSELGQEFGRRGYYIAGTEWVDFFNPEAAEFYASEQETRLRRFGIDAWWQDATEPENDDLAGRMTAVGRGEHVQLAYPLEVTKAVARSWRASVPDRRGLILTRSAFPGQQQYPAITWSGDIGNDWVTLRNQIPAGLNMAAAGYAYWTVDAGGFFRPGAGQYASPDYWERLIRWFQYATFLPIQRVHGFESDTEFWRYGVLVETICRSYLELRYRLLPYIYSLAAETTATGLPMMRPLVFDFPDDAKALDVAHSYMFGSCLHIAPVFAPRTESWPVYLPVSAGGWIDLWSGERRAGGDVHKVACPIDRIPVHVKAGSILPFGPIRQSTQGQCTDQIALFLFPGDDGHFDLYEDDGVSPAYENGACTRIALHWDDAARCLTIGDRQGSYPDMPPSRRFTVICCEGDVTPFSGSTGIVVDYAGKAVTLLLR